MVVSLFSIGSEIQNIGNIQTLTHSLGFYFDWKYEEYSKRKSQILCVSQMLEQKCL